MHMYISIYIVVYNTYHTLSNYQSSFTNSLCRRPSAVRTWQSVDESYGTNVGQIVWWQMSRSCMSFVNLKHVSGTHLSALFQITIRFQFLGNSVKNKINRSPIPINFLNLHSTVICLYGDTFVSFKLSFNIKKNKNKIVNKRRGRLKMHFTYTRRPKLHLHIV